MVRGHLYDKGLAISVGGVATRPLQGTLSLRRSLTDGSVLTFTARNFRADLGHVQRAAVVTVTDKASGDLLFSGNVLRAKVSGTSGSGTLVDVAVEAVGIEQRTLLLPPEVE